MHSSTIKAKTGKTEEHERLVAEMEAELGTSITSQEDLDILGTSPQDIVANLKAGKEGWSCERVMTVYIRSACAAHRKTNCLTEVMFHKGLEEARAKDAARAAGEEPKGAFWGLPSSFKDTYNIVGVDTSLGCTPHCFQPTTDPDKEGTLVKLCRAQGGIPFCKTNIPQTLLAFESSNPIFGAASNPYSSARTCGGSSGGEAALVTLRGTPLGWGSDIGGSLRIPAAYSGCVALKPALGRWPGAGQRPVVKGFEGIKPVVGPMARNVDDLTFASKAMIDAVMENIENHDYVQVENVVPLPWREAMLPKRMRIGYWLEDGVVRASPAAQRAVREVVAALEKEGHELVLWQPPNVAEVLKIFVALLSFDGFKQLLSNIGSDPMEPAMFLVTLGPRLPAFARWLVNNLVHYFARDPLFASVFSASKRKTIEEYVHWVDQRDQYIKTFRRAAWQEEKFDFLICPPQAVPALEHGRTKDLSPLCLATVMFNIVDSTAGVLPVTRVDAERDAAPANFLEGSTGSWILEKKVYGGTDPAYDAAKMAGLPVGVQVVGRQFEDERVLALMKIIEGAVAYDA
ncbi:uncharacterized protein CcaverHIS019_0202920 [Cutaneotrichosporon cavernicola]|uniref:amidase n=1 Tax=Cutaneotrichosporon cavernicola TaxID=279322 RepID=A0AA48I6T3_9TREE|nr:uncharacterized protein CcaverHIS019_0202920 [Cutaneotrichosporon cavernicola]BEI88930.1 hypothetical protein CcaverHIS019_0202920 [Cutaneotrichosporon cavernicola]